MEADVTSWVLRPAIWLLAGILVALGELALGTMILLPLGGTAIMVAAFLALQVYGLLPEGLVLDSWRGVAILYGVLALPTVLLIRHLFQNRRKPPDINRY